MNRLLKETFFSAFLIVPMILSQSACSKRTHDPEISANDNSPTKIDPDLGKEDPFTQFPQPIKNQSQNRSIKLLRETVIPLVDWPEQSLSERIPLIEKEAVRVGITVKISDALRKRMIAAKLIYPELRMRDVPLGAAIQYTCDSTILRYKITDTGVLLFLLQEDERAPDELGPEANPTALDSTLSPDAPTSQEPER